MPVLLLFLPVLGVTAIVLASRKHTPASVPDGAMQIELDRDMPDALVHQVLAALVHGRDAAQLEALARECDGKYPLAASELRRRAESFGAAAEGPRLLPSPSSVPHGATPATPSAPPAAPVAAAAPSLRGADVPPAPSAPPPIALPDASRVLAAVARAMTEERDPVVLEGFSDSIHALFPDAATQLAARARELRQGAPGAPASSGAPVPAPSTAPAATSASAAAPPTSGAPATSPVALAAPTAGAPPRAIYVVQAGDSELAITAHLAHDARRWHELVDANPMKVRAPDGHFAMLHPGETLILPASWSAAPVTHHEGAHP